MSEENVAPSPSPDAVPHIPHTFPPQEFVTIFAELVSGVFTAGGLVRMYFVRADGEIFGRQVNPTKIVPIGQVIMPADGFANMAAFFESRVKYMVESGDISAERVACNQGHISQSIAVIHEPRGSGIYSIRVSESRVCQRRRRNVPVPFWHSRSAPSVDASFIEAWTK